MPVDVLCLEARQLKAPKVRLHLETLGRGIEAAKGGGEPYTRAISA